MKVGKEFFITAYTMCPHLRHCYRSCCKYQIKFGAERGKWLHVLTSWQERPVRTSPSRSDILTVLSGCFSFLPATCKILYQHRLVLILWIQEQSESNAWHNIQNQKWKWEAREREDKERHNVSALKCQTGNPWTILPFLISLYLN